MKRTVDSAHRGSSPHSPHSTYFKKPRTTMAKHFIPKGPQNTADPRPAHPAHNATDRWALVVGVSDYEHAHKGISNLRFAHRDAEEIAAKLKTPSCGSFPEQNVRLLTNQDATLAQVQRSLRSFLAEPKEEDLVILYFSCHGAPDPRRPEQRYFFTYDTDPGDIAGTALPMHEIQTCISRTLRAKWVVVIADACHSGALTSTKAGGADAEVQNQFMQSLKASKESLAWLTSSQANQVSFEHQEFGNGVFTHYLLRGLEGEADGFPDGNKDGMVTIQELFQYVHEKVKEHTDHAQIPTPGSGDFDASLPLAYTGEIQARDYFEVGKSTFYLGEALSDPDRLLAAEYYFQRSIALSRGLGHNYEAHLLSIRARVAAGDFAKAMDALTGFTGFMESQMKKGELRPENLNRLGEAYYLQGILHLLLESPFEHVQACQKKLNQAFPGDPRIGTLEELLRLRTFKKSRMFVILVGIDQYEQDNAQLSGALNDIGIIEEVLFKRWERVGDVQLVRLQNGSATKSRIELAFRKVAEEAQPLDSFLFHFSGMGGALMDPKYRTVILPFDGKIGVNGGEVSGTIQADLFHDLMKSIPCIQKFAILDTVASPALVALAEEEPLYNLLYGSSIGKNCLETVFEEKNYGVFSKSVAEALEHSSGPTFWQDVLENVRRYKPEQEPMLVGDTGFLFEAVPYSLPVLLEKVFVLAEVPTLSDIRILECFFSRVPHFQELRIRLVQLFEKYKLYKNGQAQMAELEKLGFLPSFILPTATQIYYENKAHHKAMDIIRELYKRFPEGSLAELLGRYTALLEAPPYALLVGVDDTAIKEDGSAPLLVSRQLQDLAEALQQVFGLKAENIALLMNEEATFESIQAAFEGLVQKTGSSPALFYFAGSGRVVTGPADHPTGSKGIGYDEVGNGVGELRLLSADGKEISLALLQELVKAGTPENLSTCFDCVIAANLDHVSQYNISPVGAFSLVSGYIENRIGWRPGCLENKDGGVFTQALLHLLKQTPAEGLKISELLKALKKQEIPFAGTNSIFPRVFGVENERFLQPDPLLKEDMKRIREFFLRMAREGFSRFESYDPRALIELAFVQHCLGDSKGGIRTLEGLRGKEFPIDFPLGRILVESAGKDDKEQWNHAVKALRGCPDQNNPAVSYYLGKALLGSILAENEAEVEKLFSRYAEAGFPLGYREEVETYLNSRNPEKHIRFLLLKARNKEREQKWEEALGVLAHAASLDSKKALEGLVDLSARLKRWDKVMAAGTSLMLSGQGSEFFEVKFINYMLEALGQEYPVHFLKDLIEKSEKVHDRAKLLSWIAAYQKFLKKNPIPSIKKPQDQ